MKLTTTKVSVPVLMMLLAQSGYGADWFVNVLDMLHNQTPKAEIVQYVQNHAPADAAQISDDAKEELVADWETKIKKLLVDKYIPAYLTGDDAYEYAGDVCGEFTAITGEVDADAIKNAWINKISGDFFNSESKANGWWHQDETLAAAIDTWTGFVKTKWTGSVVPAIDDENLNSSLTSFIEEYSITGDDADTKNKDLLKSKILTKANHLDALQGPDSETTIYEAVKGAVDIAEVKSDIRGALVDRANKVRLDAVIAKNSEEEPFIDNTEHLADRIKEAVDAVPAGSDAEATATDRKNKAIEMLYIDDAEDVVAYRDENEQTKAQESLVNYLEDRHQSFFDDDLVPGGGEIADKVTSKIIEKLGNIGPQDDKLEAVENACKVVFDSLLYNSDFVPERADNLKTVLDAENATVDTILATLNDNDTYKVQYFAETGANLQDLENSIKNYLNWDGQNQDQEPTLDEDKKGKIANLLPKFLEIAQVGDLGDNTPIWSYLKEIHGNGEVQPIGEGKSTVKDFLQTAIVKYFYDNAWKKGETEVTGWAKNIANVWAGSVVPDEITGDLNTGVSKFIAGYSIPAEGATEAEIVAIDANNKALLKTTILTKGNNLDALQDPGATIEVPNPETPTYGAVRAVFNGMEKAPKDAIHDALSARAAAVRTDVLTDDTVGIVENGDIDEDINKIIASNDDPIASLEDKLIENVVKEAADETTALAKYLKFYRQRVQDDDTPTGAGIAAIKAEISNSNFGEDNSENAVNIKTAIDSVIGDKMQSFLRHGEAVGDDNEALIGTVDGVIIGGDIEDYVQEIDDADAATIANDVNSIIKNGGLIPQNSED